MKSGSCAAVPYDGVSRKAQFILQTLENPFDPQCCRDAFSYRNAVASPFWCQKRQASKADASTCCIPFEPNLLGYHDLMNLGTARSWFMFIHITFSVINCARPGLIDASRWNSGKLRYKSLPEALRLHLTSIRLSITRGCQPATYLTYFLRSTPNKSRLSSRRNAALLESIFIERPASIENLKRPR